MIKNLFKMAIYAIIVYTIYYAYKNGLDSVPEMLKELPNQIPQIIKTIINLFKNIFSNAISFISELKKITN